MNKGEGKGMISQIDAQRMRLCTYPTTAALRPKHPIRVNRRILVPVPSPKDLEV